MISQIVEDLLNMQDKAYRDFHSRLIPSIEYERIIGVRTPNLRKYANKIIKQDISHKFLEDLPHFYYEENNLHAFLLEKIKDYDECVKRLDIFLDYVNNWATCDGMNPTCFKHNIDKLHKNIMVWLESESVYKIRFGIVMLLKYYLGELFDEKFLLKVLSVDSNDYYIYMAKAWYLAEALVKQYDVAVKYFESKCIPKDVHNKAIQKAVESYRITQDKKNYLKSLKI